MNNQLSFHEASDQDDDVDSVLSRYAPYTVVNWLYGITRVDTVTRYVSSLGLVDISCLTMAWRCTGRTNGELISNLKRNEIFHSERVMEVNNRFLACSKRCGDLNLMTRR